jgi:hypothetical protein
LVYKTSSNIIWVFPKMGVAPNHPSHHDSVLKAVTWGSPSLGNRHFDYFFGPNPSKLTKGLWRPQVLTVLTSRLGSGDFTMQLPNGPGVGSVP